MKAKPFAQHNPALPSNHQQLVPSWSFERASTFYFCLARQAICVQPRFPLKFPADVLDFLGFAFLNMRMPMILDTPAFSKVALKAF